MYLMEKSLTANRYPRQTIAVVMHTHVPRAALRPLAIRLSCLRRIPSSDAIIEYAVTTHARAKANWPICAMSTLSYACCGFFLVFGGAFGLHFVGDEHAVMPELAFNDGLRPIDERIRRGIVADVLHKEGFDLLRLLVLLADHKIDHPTIMLNRAGHDVSCYLQVPGVRLIFRCVQFGNRLVIRITFLEARIGQISQGENDHDGAKDKLKLFAFHGFIPPKSQAYYSTMTVAPDNKPSELRRAS